MSNNIVLFWLVTSLLCAVLVSAQFAERLVFVRLRTGHHLIKKSRHALPGSGVRVCGGVPFDVLVNLKEKQKHCGD